jgi:hypothetical protein
MAKHIVKQTPKERTQSLHEARKEELAARAARKRQEVSERQRTIVNTGYALKAFSERVDLQLTALAAGIADIKRLLAVKAKEPA